MKKFLVVLVALFTVNAVSAQFDNVGIRFNGGVEIVGQYDMGQTNHIDARLGLGNGWVGLTGIYTWEIAQFNWTPSFGKWFFDAGVGANVTAGGIFNLAVVGSAQFGIKFNNAPISITIDAQPALNLTHVVDLGFGGGISIAYHF